MTEPTATDANGNDTLPVAVMAPDYAPNVVLALCRVMGELPNIGKTMESPQGYNYRGIEQITKEAQPLFAKHGIVIAPRHIEWRDTVQLQINNRPWTDEKLIVHYRCYGPGGAMDYMDIEVPGIGRDNADKGSNKAMSQAYKYALLQALMIADGKDDSDSHDVPGADAPLDSAMTPATRAQMDDLRNRVRMLRERGVETAETNDVQEVKVLGQQLLRRNEDGDLIPALTINEAETLAGKLQAEAVALADRLLEGAEPGHTDATQPPSGPAAPTPDQPADAAQAATEQPVRQPSEQELAARAALDRVSQPSPPSNNEGAGQLRGVKGDDEAATKAKAHVNRMDLSKVVEQLTGADVPIPDAKPAAIRRQLADRLAAQMRAAAQ